jgi:hypothetical protein
MAGKLKWSGQVTSVQPRIRLHRSFDERWHSYMGFALRIEGTIGGEAREFLVGIGKAAQAKHGLRVGDVVEGASVAVSDPRTEPVDFYKTSGFKLVERGAEAEPGPPWLGVPPTLETYRARGHRRLAARTYVSSCGSCLWGARMPVEIVVDHWDPGRKRYRSETFCYGPKSCRLYRPGPTRKVPGRNGMTFEEADWIDEDATAHRSEDE